MGKRKRQADDSATKAPAAKKQVTETATSTSAAERRQQRSERKSKKGQKAKDNVQRKHVASQPEVLLPGADATTENDIFAGGEDFVPLTDATNTAPISKPLSASISTSNPPHSVQNKSKLKPKRSSPRSERKKSKEAKAQAAALEAYGPSTLSNSSTNPNTAVTSTKQKQKRENKDAPRFIAFVGNLPFSTTTDQIQSHFRKLAPTSIRHNTDKATGKSRGFAFLEFDDYSAMKTCLKVYHHSIFDPERTAKLPDSAFDENGLEIPQPGQEAKRRGRKINVELTAGGGGRSNDRQEKIKRKNEKLFDERERRKKAEMKEENIKKQKKTGTEPKKEEEENPSTDIGSEAVHPSRLKRVKH